MNDKKFVSIDDAITAEMCNNCSYAANYSIWSNDYYCFKKMGRGNFSICEEYTHSKWVSLKTWLKSWIYLLR